MRVVERWDEEGNPIFKVGSKRISFNSALLRMLVSRNISIINLNCRGAWGQAWGSTVELNFPEIIGLGKKNSSIKRDIAETLAHEIGHVLQPKAGLIDRLALSLMSFSFLLPLLFVLIFLGMAGGGIFTFLEFEQWLSLAFWFLALAAYLSILGILSLYYFSPNERDARGFAKKAVQKEEWLKVVKVEDIDTP